MFNPYVCTSCEQPLCAGVDHAYCVLCEAPIHTYNLTRSPTYNCYYTKNELCTGRAYVLNPPLPDLGSQWVDQNIDDNNMYCTYCVQPHW